VAIPPSPAADVVVPGNGDVENWWFRRRPTLGGVGSDDVAPDAVGYVNTSCGGLAPSRLENATVSLFPLVSVKPYAPAPVTCAVTSNSTHCPSVAALLAAICAAVVAGRLL